MITTDIDFTKELIVDKNWRQFTVDGNAVIELSDGSVITAHHEAGFMFDHASIPPIPFFRLWRFDPRLNMASYIHDLYFIHQYKDYKRASWIMNDIMKTCGVPTLMRIIIYKAVKSNIAKRLFLCRNKYDASNQCLSTIVELNCT